MNEHQENILLPGERIIQITSAGNNGGMCVWVLTNKGRVLANELCLPGGADWVVVPLTKGAGVRTQPIPNMRNDNDR